MRVLFGEALMLHPLDWGGGISTKEGVIHDVEDKHAVIPDCDTHREHRGIGYM